MTRRALRLSTSSVSASQYRIALAVAAAAAGLVGRSAIATPYASQVTNSGGTVSYYLNQSATDVTVTINGVPHDLGAQNAGQQSFSLGAGTSYQITVSNASGPGFNSFSSAPTLTQSGGGTLATGAVQGIGTLTGLSNARSIAINQDPTSAYFGRTYFAEGDVGTSYTNSDLSNQVRNNGGFTYNGGVNSPFRLTVGPDDNVYVSDWNDAQSTIYMQDPNLNNNQTVLKGIGDTSNINVHGSIVSKILFVGTPGTSGFAIQALDEDLTLNNGVPTSYTAGNGPAGSAYQSLWQWNLGTSSINYNSSPSLIANFPTVVGQTHGTTNDVARGRNGDLYFLVNRSVGTDSAGIVVTDSTGQSSLWNSWTTTNALAGAATSTTLADALRNVNGVAISPDGSEMALASYAPGPGFIIVPLTNGIPDLNRARLVQAGPGTYGRDVAFDAAGNLAVTDSHFLSTLETGNSGAAVYSPGGLTQTVYSNNAAGTAGAFNSTSVDPTWISTAGGNFSDNFNWFLSYSPNIVNGSGGSAKFGPSISSNATINLDSSPSLGTVSFDSSHSYTLSGGNLTLSTLDPAGAQVNVLSGNHIIASTVNLASNTTVKTTHPADSITFSGGMSPNNAVSLTVGGAGTTNIPALNSNNFRALSVTGGSLKLTAPRASSNTDQVTDVSVAAGATLDVGSNDLIDNYSNNGSPDATRLSTIQGLLKSGYNGGTWTGKGITSSTAAAVAASTNVHKTALGYSEASADGLGNHNGVGLDNDSIVIVYTYSGDATLDGTVDSNDFAALAANYGKTSGVGWIQGDFNYDGTVNALDFNALATNYGQTSLAASGDLPEAAALGSIVPEPATLSLIGLAALGLAGRRRRCRRCM